MEHQGQRAGLELFSHRRTPEAHQQFRDDNRDSKIPCTKIILCGIVHPRYYARGRCIWEKRSLFQDRAVWHLELDVNSEDRIVYMLGFLGAGYQGLEDDCGYEPYRLDNGALEDRSGGLWVLRPAGEESDGEFTLIACLTRTPNGDFPLYDY